jgi:hypothetical protein
MDRTQPTTTLAPPTEACDRIADPRPRYEPPRLVKRRSLVQGTGQSYVSSMGTSAGGLPVSG